jgi:hypothetical protein
MPAFFKHAKPGEVDNPLCEQQIVTASTEEV